MVFPKRRLKTTSTQCTRERKPTAGGGGNTINTNATTEVPAAAGVHTAAAAAGILTAAAAADHAAADHAAAAYTAAAAITATAGGFVFKHPFTATISGPTSCGKTHFCKVILQHCLMMIWPPPERILWLYKRWQPLYDVIKSTVYPSVEFIQGIPLDLDQDSFIHHRTRNLVILDDLMSTASKDSRINELFTEGSHHRNLSVIAINQNLYYNKDPTQRRNCHYMVMFNNPVDKQQIMTLSRQMYPENSQHLLRHFKEATSKPYRYLLVDLKPTTPEHLHMRTDIMNTIKPK